MTRIRILPEILSNKIAAGEVVERPASVVKELLENALDAGSTRVDIEIGGGGRSLIRVADNGCGMGRDDALLALERYATSKIREDSDLFAIRTLGFRGEALPSIAAVSRFALVSCEAGGGPGTEIEMAGGRLLAVRETGAPPGTMVTVRQLFYNTPARRKFLKTVSTEMGHIAETVARTALGWPGVRFRLRHNGREVRNWPAADAARRVADVLGRDAAGKLHAVKADGGGLTLRGWIAVPAVSRKTWRGLHLFVNGRPVRDAMLQHALLAGYTGRLMKGRYPLAALFLTLPPDGVDVNVHPTKSQVRFVRPMQVREAVTRAAADTLRKVERPPWQRPGEPSPARSAQPLPPTDSPSGPRQVAEFPAPYRAPSTPEALPSSSSPERAPDSGLAPVPRDRQAAMWEVDFLETLRVIGQYRETYILCESSAGLVIVDQHAAHERIVYEGLLDRSRRGRTAVQRLLVPETVELGYREAALMERMVPELQAAGLEIEPFGGRTFVIQAVPAVLAGGALAPLVIELAEKMLETGAGPGVRDALDEGLKVVACHGAIRARQRLAAPQLQELFRQLAACDNPAHCPHGRPVWVLLEDRELEKRFGRVT